jgi:hypothetical protein
LVRANHPWRLVTSLSRALIVAIGVAAFAIVSSDVWRIAAQIDATRLAVVCVATICASVATLIIEHGLWERAADRQLREQAILFNVVTLITVAFGVIALYRHEPDGSSGRPRRRSLRHREPAQESGRARGTLRRDAVALRSRAALKLSAPA